MEKETYGALYQSDNVSERKLLFEILKDLGDSFHKQKAKDFIGSFHFLIFCDKQEVEFTIQVRNCEYRIIYDYVDTNPFLKIQCTFEMFCNITLGNFNPVFDILNHKIRLDKGLLSLPRFAKFGSLFSYREIDLKLPTTIKHPETWVKPEKFLLVNGSPRKYGSTKLMLEWFYEGLPAESVDVVDVSALKIARCTHCFKCWTDHPDVCAIDDDAKFFRQKVDEADLIVFFVPLSYASMPSDMKRALERLFPETTPFFYHNANWNATAHPLHKNKKPQSFLQFLV